MNIIKPPARDVGRSLRSERYKEMSKIKKLIDGINAGIQSTKERGDEADTITMTLPEMEYTAKALRKKQERENPKPLTLDELIRMDGEPVWIEDKQDGGQWGLVDLNHKTLVWYEPPVQAMVLKDGNFYILREYEAYGENLQAYRTKPEGR